MASRHPHTLHGLQRGNDRVIAGVCSGLAASLRVDPIVVRVAFIVLTIAGGFALPVYLVLWWLVPDSTGQRGIRLEQLDVSAGELRQPLAIALVVGGTLLLLRELGLWFSDALVWPVALLGFGLALLWARSGEEDRARLASAANRLPGRPLEVLIGGRQAVLRVAVGALLVAAGVGAFVATSDAVTAARQVVIAVVVTVAGFALILAPWLRRLTTDLANERRERIRSEERAEMAAHLHDSVLQTLALIQRKADQPRELVALARQQERELRAWLYGAGKPSGTTFASAIEAVAAEIETLHGIEVEVVPVGDLPLDAATDALVQATREAVVNAAKHSGVPTVSVYVEVEGDRATVFVRDRGKGFDPEAVPSDRRGISHSICDRLARHGGRATITSAPGEGTEVMLEVSRA